MKEHTPRENTPVPDPSVLTTDAIATAIDNTKDYIDGKIALIDERAVRVDKASEVLAETINRVPTALTEAIKHVREVVDERFNSVAIQFKERDTRSEREARDNKLAVDAAFAAQEKQAVAQNESNALAISKSEAATTETIKTNQELTKAVTDSLTKSLDEVKLSQARILAVKQGSTESSGNVRNTLFTSIAAVAAVIAALSLILTYTHLKSNIAQTPPTQTVTVP